MRIEWELPTKKPPAWNIWKSFTQYNQKIFKVWCQPFDSIRWHNRYYEIVRSCLKASPFRFPSSKNSKFMLQRKEDAIEDMKLFASH